MHRQQRRLHRQFSILGRKVPGGPRMIDAFLNGRLQRVRVPLGLLLILGGMLWFLPILGLWMIPLGLLLLAVDIPALQPGVSAAVIRARRLIRLWLGRPSRG